MNLSEASEYGSLSQSRRAKKPWIQLGGSLNIQEAEDLLD